jgi:hypothetical protein
MVVGTSPAPGRLAASRLETSRTTTHDIGMSSDLLHQIDILERECHAALGAGDDAATIKLLVHTLNTVNFTTADEERPIVRGLANMASTHADMLLHTLTCDAPAAVVHDGLIRLCDTLRDLRAAITQRPFHVP